MAKAWNNSRTSSVSNAPIFSAGKLRPEDEERPAGDVEGDARQRLVHRQMDVGIAADALLVAERLHERLAERDAGVLDRVVVVDMQVALHLDREVDQRMAGEEVEHMVEEADAGRDLGLAGAVESERHGDIGLVGAAADARGAHGPLSLLVEARAF